MKTRDGIVSVKNQHGRVVHFRVDLVEHVCLQQFSRIDGVDTMVTAIRLVSGNAIFTKMPKYKVLRRIGWAAEKHAPWLEFNDTKPTWWDTHLALIKDEQRILAIRHIREETGLGLKEAKAISDRVVDLLKAGVIP